MTRAPLAVLDLVPRSSGDSISSGVANAIELAQQAERFGYQRYWFAEHHLNPGVLGASPAVTIALAAAATSTIRIGSAGVQLGHRQPLAVVEEFGLLDAAYPGRLDLGLGRSIGRSKPSAASGDEKAEPAEAAADAALADRLRQGPHSTDRHAPNGLLLPKQFDVRRLLAGSKGKLAQLLGLLQQPGAYTPDYESQISAITELIAGTHAFEGGPVRAFPGEGAAVQLWILGASGGVSATLAGERGLRFAASYHLSPSTVLDAVEAYRSAFRPSADLDEPYISVSADVVVGETDEQAAELAAGYALWVRSIRTGEGAIPFPSPKEVAAHEWTEEDRALVRDRVDTQVIGSPTTVADKLEQLRDATGAGELAITTITHQHADRVRSYRLLAEEWDRRGN